MRVLVVADRGDSDAGFVGRRLEELGGELVLHEREDFPADGPLELGDAAYDLLLLLGSRHGVADPARTAPVATESALVQQFLGADRPVIGICYGAQLAAHTLGGTVSKADEPEIGWYYVESNDPALCPPGPWMHYHYDRFTVPEGARQLGTSSAGPQGFAVEDAIGRLRLVAWQFHPEVTPATLERWLEEGADELAGLGVDPAAVSAEAAQRERVTRAATYALVDVTLDAMGLLPARIFAADATHSPGDGRMAP